MAENEVTPEMLAEQIRQLKIEDILLSTVSTLGQLAYAKLDGKDVEQARLAIDAIAALLPTLEGRVDEQVIRDFKQLLANLRLAFTDTVSVSGSEPQTKDSAGTTAQDAPGEAEERDESEPETSPKSGSGTEPQTPEGDGSKSG